MEFIIVNLNYDFISLFSNKKKKEKSVLLKGKNVLLEPSNSILPKYINCLMKVKIT